MSPRLISNNILGLPSEDEEKSAETPPDSQQPTLATRRSRAPTDIDIRSISSHARAGVLVQLAQKSILDMEDVPGGDFLNGSRSALSAKLAAYGESLALERWFKRVEERKTGESQFADDRGLPSGAAFTQDSSVVVVRACAIREC
jgi:hypothetical protein